MTTAPPRRNLPGRPTADMLAEYQKTNAERRQHEEPILWQFFAPDPDTFVHCRIKLDCGCVKDALWPASKEGPPLGPWLDWLSHAWLPEGQYRCDHGGVPFHSGPIQDVVEWRDCEEKTLDPDPVEPPDWWPADDREGWREYRTAEPRTFAYWRVLLACGHVDEVRADVGWQPSDGPTGKVSEQRRLELLAELAAGRVDSPTREWWQHWTEAGCPTPHPFLPCDTCPVARQIVAWQRVGPLVRPPRRPPAKPTAKDRLALAEQNLARAQAQVEQLRREAGE